jgi:hypothetical protein
VSTIGKLIVFILRDIVSLIISLADVTTANVEEEVGSFQ